MMMKTKRYRALTTTLLCAILTACGGGGDQSGDQLLNSAGELTAAERASRDSAVHADAGDDLVIEVNSEIAVNGSNSYDELSTDQLTLTWSIIQGPNNANVSTSIGNNGQLLIATDTVGTYTVRLSVTDGYNTDTDDVTIIVVEPNPVAVLPEPFSAQVGSTVTIIGSNSYDAIDDTLVYQWSVTAPDGNAGSLEDNETDGTINLVLDAVGTFTVELTVIDSDGNESVPVQTTVTATNEPPAANAGADIEAPYNTTIEVSASESNDAEQGTLSYNWSLTGRPANSTATLSGSTEAITASFFADQPGQYTLQVVVSDGYTTSTDNITVNAINTLPTVDAGENKTIQSGSSVTLTATASDPETSALTYSWALVSQPNGPIVDLNGTTSTVSAILHAGGLYRLEVTVSDGYDAVKDTVDVYVNNNIPVSVITISNNNLIPVRGDNITISGSHSFDPDDNDQIESYEWIVTKKPSDSLASFADPSAVTTQFNPDVAGDYTLALRTFDGGDYSELSTVDILVLDMNNVPTAIATFQIENYNIIHLDGSQSSDPDNHEISYLWSIIATPDNAPAQIAHRTGKTTEMFVIENGTYAIRLTVSDGRNNSAPFDFTVTIDRPNEQPIANAGAPQNVGADQLVTLNGGESYDADGDVITFSWFMTTPDGSTALLNDQHAVSPSFTPDLFGTYTATLTVSDGELVSEPESVIITVDNTHAPVADAGRDQNIKTGSRVQLSGANSIDIDSSIESYTWYFQSKPADSAAQLDSIDTITTSFTPDVDGTYIVALIVEDEALTSEPSFVTVIATTGNAAPIANAGNDIVIVQGTLSTVLLSGATSTDADGDELSYSWSLISQPTYSEALLTSINTAETRLPLDRYGDYLAQLTVFDGTVSSTPDTKLIRYVRSGREVDAGPDTITYPNNIVVLDGRSSAYIIGRDPESYEYEWQFVSTPTDDTPTISEHLPEEGESAEDVDGLYQFQPPVAGTYVVRLRFRNTVNGTVSDVDSVIIDVRPYNRLPVADAGDDITTTRGELIILDGSGSSDVDGDSLQYNWSIIDRPFNSQAVLENPNSVNPFFTVDTFGEFLVLLQVFDGASNSDPSVVRINSIEPTVTLEIRSEDGFRRVNMPFSKTETFEATNPMDGSELIIDTFRISAIEQNITIVDVQAYDANGLVNPYLGVTSNTIIRSGNSLEIQLIADYPDAGRQANLIFEFTVKETGETVTATYLFSSR